MSRHERRRAAKLSRNATPDEILGGDHREAGHRPPDDNQASMMTAALNALREGLPGYDFALFMFEKKPAAGRELPRFNYGSTCDRADMVNVLNAFVQKNAHLLHKLDALERETPAGSVQ